MSPHAQSQVASLNRYIIHLKANKQQTHALPSSTMMMTMTNGNENEPSTRWVQFEAVQWKYCHIGELCVKSRLSLEILTLTDAMAKVKCSIKRLTQLSNRPILNLIAYYHNDFKPLSNGALIAGAQLLVCMCALCYKLQVSIYCHSCSQINTIAEKKSLRCTLDEWMDVEDEQDKSEITFHYISILSKINVIHFVTPKGNGSAAEVGEGGACATSA